MKLKKVLAATLAAAMSSKHSAILFPLAEKNPVTSITVL